MIRTKAHTDQKKEDMRYKLLNGSRESLPTHRIRNNNNKNNNDENDDDDDTYTDNEMQSSGNCLAKCMVICNRCIQGCCSKTRKGIYYFFWILLVLAVLGLAIWNTSLQANIEELQHKDHASQKSICSVHMHSSLVRPEPDLDNLYAMGHGSITLDKQAGRVCYNVITSNITGEAHWFGLYGPIYSFDPEVADIRLNMSLPSYITDPGLYTNCVSNVTDFFFEDFTSKVSLFYFSMFSDDPPREVMISYVDYCS